MKNLKNTDNDFKKLDLFVEIKSNYWYKDDDLPNMQNDIKSKLNNIDNKIRFGFIYSLYVQTAVAASIILIASFIIFTKVNNTNNKETHTINAEMITDDNYFVNDDILTSEIF